MEEAFPRFFNLQPLNIVTICFFLVFSPCILVTIFFLFVGFLLPCDLRTTENRPIDVYIQVAGRTYSYLERIPQATFPSQTLTMYSPKSLLAVFLPLLNVAGAQFLISELSFGHNGRYQ
jgi:hypothetical protein